MTEEVCRWGAEADPEEDVKTRVTKTSEVQKESQASAHKERVYRGERRNTTPSHPGNGRSKAGRQTESKVERQQGGHRETEREAERQQGRGDKLAEDLFCFLNCSSSGGVDEDKLEQIERRRRDRKRGIGGEKDSYGRDRDRDQGRDRDCDRDSDRDRRSSRLERERKEELKVFVGGLSWGTTDESLRMKFEEIAGEYGLIHYELTVSTGSLTASSL